MAKLVSCWSKDPGHKVGAVIVRPDRTVASLGYNGFPRGVEDKYEDRETKLLKTVHAEMNAILSAREPLKGYMLYVSPLFPCANCAAGIVQSGIAQVVADLPKDTPDAWAKSFEVAAGMFDEVGIGVSVYRDGDLHIAL